MSTTALNKAPIGSLRHRITIQKPTRVADGNGGYTETWSTYSTVWADIQPWKGSERFIAEQVAHVPVARVLVRYDAGIQSSYRVLYGTRTLQIKSVTHPFERLDWTELLCEEGVAT